MKIYNVVAACFFCILFSCVNKESPTLVSKAPEGDTRITVSGHKKVMFDPWEVTLVVKTPQYEKGITLQIYSGSLNKDNVNFNWNGNNCLVTFTQQDNTKTRVQIRQTENSLSIKEI